MILVRKLIAKTWLSLGLENKWILLPFPHSPTLGRIKAILWINYSWMTYTTITTHIIQQTRHIKWPVNGGWVEIMSHFFFPDNSLFSASMISFLGLGLVREDWLTQSKGTHSLWVHRRPEAGSQLLGACKRSWMTSCCPAAGGIPAEMAFPRVSRPPRGSNLELKLMRDFQSCNISQ